MDYINLGTSGLRVSRVCLGMLPFAENSERSWVLGERDAEPIVRAAVEGGVTFFDTSDNYSFGKSEITTGRLLKQMLHRDDLVISTKVFHEVRPGENNTGLSRKHIMSAIDQSLERLGMDYVDLYQIHKWDHRTPIEETMGALHDVVRSGKARYIGASAMYAWQFAKAQHVAELHGFTKFVSMQNQYNLAYREEEREMLPLCVDQGVGVIPFSPLARGVLAGSMSRGGIENTPRSKGDRLIHTYYDDVGVFDVVDALALLANERGESMAKIALAWLFHKPVVTAPIVGATKLQHVQDALDAAHILLSDEEIARLETPYQARRVLGNR